MSKLVRLAILLVSAAAPSLAPVMATAAEKAAFYQDWDFKYDLENYFDGHARDRSVSVINPNNQVLKVEDFGATADLRPDLSLTTDRTKWVVRPRWVLDAYQWSEGSPQKSYQYSEGRLDLTDAYVDIRWLESLHTTTGLEVYEWGPAELANVSNPLFHLNTFSRSSFYKEKGQVLARLSWDLGEQWNNMLIANPVSNNEPPFMAEQTFKPSAFVKSEYRSKGGQSYAGALGGTQPDGRAFFGEYFQLGFESGWSVYLDARHPIGERRFELAKAPGGFQSESLISNDTGVYALAIAGLRYEGRVDARLEYFYNYDGFTADEFRDQMNAFRTLSPYTPLNLSRFLRPGLELYGQHYAYASIRVPDLGRRKDLTVALRSLTSLQDGSTLGQFSLDKPLSDSTVLLLEAYGVLGGDDQELTLLERAGAVAGLKWTL